MKIIADCCNNHEGSLYKIKQMIWQLAELHIDYVKFQIFTADKLNASYPNYDKMYENYKKCELSEYTIKKIVEFCDDRITPLFTLFDDNKAYMLRKYSNIVKIASPDCNNWKLLDIVFSLFDKVIISTGMHTIKEIEMMLKRYKKHSKKIVLLYCKSQYPAVYTQRDIDKKFKIQELNKNGFGISDHCNNVDGFLVYGNWYEHHFTLEKTGKPDDAVSWTIQEFADFLGIGDEYENRLKYKARWV